MKLDIPIKDHFRESRVFSNRLTITIIGIAILCLLLIIRLVYLQVVSHTHYETLSQKNRINSLPLPPVRGLILDRNGVVLAQNFPVYTLEIIPELVDDMESLLNNISKLITVSERDLEHFNKQIRRRPKFEPQTLRTHLSDAEAAKIAVKRPFMAGVELRARLQRHYPLGTLGIHALGYVARISESDQRVIDTSLYRGTQHIGKLGVEKSYETSLLGNVGIERNEVNAYGRKLREVTREAPVAGENLYLNIDTRLQALAEKALSNKRGAVVAIEPATGAVLTFASMPIYDPNQFVNGIDIESYKSLLDNPDKPLINRALNGQYAPGSTIKPFLGLAGLVMGKTTTTSEINCRGWYSLPGSRHRFRDWKKSGHGTVNIKKAITESCDVFYYKLATRLGIKLMTQTLAPFGFGHRTGIDLALESKGLLPTQEWKDARNEPWYAGETVVVGIGQGPILVTPLQLANATAMLANKGIRMQPMLRFATENPESHKMNRFSPKVKSRLPEFVLPHLSVIHEAMINVVHGKMGTGRRIGRDAKYKIAGKTGTAQVRGIKQNEVYNKKLTPERFRDHALFISYAPADDPKIAVAVIVENGGHGSSAAAPIARKLMDEYLLGNAS